MAEEKRVQLGVDVGELSNQLVQINNLVEQNYQKALQGQASYNKILEESIVLLERQSELIQGIGDSLQNSLSNKGSIPIMGSGVIEGGKDKQNDLSDIKENVESILEFFSELGNPIPVEVKNTPLQVKIVEGNINEGGQGEFSENNNKKQNEENNQGRVGGVNQYANTATSLFQKDPNYMLPAVAGIFLGSGIASALSKIITEAELRERAKARLVGTTGRENASLGSFTDIGLSEAEAMQREAAYYRRNVGLSRSDLYFERGLNLSEGIMSSLLQSFRKDLIHPNYSNELEYYSSSIGAYKYLEELTSKAGIEKEEVRGYSEEYLKILVDINQKQLETTGETYSLLNADFIQSISQINSKFDDPVRLSRVVNTLYGGLQQANTPQMEAMQYYALSQVNPNASLWEMQLMKEDPTKTGRGYFANLISLLMQTGNEQDVKFNIMNAFPGLKAWDVEDMMVDFKARMQDSNFNLIEYLEGKVALDFIKNRPAEESAIIAEGKRATASTEVGIAEMSDLMAKLGTPLLGFQKIIADKVTWIVEKIEQWAGENKNSSNDIITNQIAAMADEDDPSWKSGGFMGSHLTR